MKNQKQSLRPSRNAATRGFTIVELLIVIIVIAILAFVTITAYNGVQQRAANAKTIAAVEAWVKAFRLYNADTGSWPTTYPACLGTGYPTGNPTGVGQCYKNTDFIEKAAFNTEMAPYIGQGPLPTPDFTAIGVVAENWRRGAYYNQNASGVIISFVVQGAGACPSIGGVNIVNSTLLGIGRYCSIQLEPPA